VRDAKDIVDFLRAQQRRHSRRDNRWQDIRSARNNDLSAIAPDMFSEDFPKPITANFIDTVARDLAELIAPLPAFQCASASMQSDKARSFADRRTKIVQNYMAHARVETQMLTGADHYNTYAAAVFYLEPDLKNKLPRITMETPIGGYADMDRWGRVRSYIKVFQADAWQLSQMFPEFAGLIDKSKTNLGVPGSDNIVEIIRYCDAQQIALVLCSKEPVVLTSTANPLGETPIIIARKPWLDGDEYRGQWDDVVWIAVARDILARLNLEAVEKTVQAPLALPNDVQELPFGPDAVLRTNTPEKIRRVGLELSNAGFGEAEVLMQEMRLGSRYPEARSGSIDASVITGRGVAALTGTFDAQVKTAQLAFKQAFVDVVRLALKMDETYWPNVVKSIAGQANGTPYELKYKPSRDIAGDYTCDVEYGFAAGMDANRAVVMLLQLRAEKAFSRDFFIRQLPFAINISEEQSKIDVEETREALKQGIYAFVQAIPAMAQQGMDPGDAVAKLTAIVKGLQKGRSIEDVAYEAFAPPPPPPQAAGMGEEGDPMAGEMGAGGDSGGGLTDSGRMVGVPPGQAGMAPGGRPDLSVMLAGLSNQGQPQMSAAVSRRRAV
jgi:hypothetical protein